MTYKIILLNNNVKLAIYTGKKIHVLYRYIEIILSPNSLTSLGQRSRHVGTLSYIQNDTETIQPVIEAMRVWKNIIFKCCERIGHKADAWIICGTIFLPPSLRINMSQFNYLRSDEPSEPTRECKIQHYAVHFKYHISPPKILVTYDTVHMVTSKRHKMDKKTPILRCTFLHQNVEF